MNNKMTRAQKGAQKAQKAAVAAYKDQVRSLANESNKVDQFQVYSYLDYNGIPQTPWNTYNVPSGSSYLDLIVSYSDNTIQEIWVNKDVPDHYELTTRWDNGSVAVLEWGNIMVEIGMKEFLARGEEFFSFIEEVEELYLTFKRENELEELVYHKTHHKEYFLNPEIAVEYLIGKENPKTKKPFQLAETNEESVVLQYHGLCAYSGDSDITNKFVSASEKGFVLCGSDKAIGAVGIIFDGVVHKAFLRDAWSNIEEREGVNKTAFVNEVCFADASAHMVGTSVYIETWTVVDHVYGFWCRKDVPSTIKQEVKALAKEYNLPIFWGHPNRIGKFRDHKQVLRSFDFL